MSARAPCSRWAVAVALATCLFLAGLCSAAGQEAKQRTVDLGGGLTMALVLIPPGSFVMGTTDAQAKALERTVGRVDSERPAHKVWLSKAFWIGKHEVTVGQYRRFVEAAGYKTDAEKGTGGKGARVYDHAGETSRAEDACWRNPHFRQSDDDPVVCVSWNDARAFVDWLNRLDNDRPPGMSYRLPTEAEWEYACRAGTSSLYQWGDDRDGARGWCNGADLTMRDAGWISGRMDFMRFDWNDGYLTTAPVGSFRANAFGLHDMLGNVWEWCQDYYGQYKGGDQTDPVGPATGQSRVFRGCSWRSSPGELRCANRDLNGPSDRSVEGGFRLALAGAFGTAKAEETTAPERAPAAQTAGELVQRGMTKMANGDVDGAMADFTEAIRLEPGDFQTHRWRGHLKCEKGDYDGAIADYTKAIELKPDYAEAYQLRAFTRKAKGDYEGAISDYDRAIQLRPNNPDAYYSRGRAKHAKRDYDGAIADYTKALEGFRPDEKDIEGTRAEVIANLERARAERAAAGKAPAAETARALVERGMTKGADVDGAIADFTEAIRLDPGYAPAHEWRALARIRKLDYDGAIADWTRVLQLRPDDPWAYYNRGCAKHAKRDYDGAIADYTKAIETQRLRPNEKGADAILAKASADLERAKAQKARTHPEKGREGPAPKAPAGLQEVPYLGFDGHDLDPGLAGLLQLKAKSGVLVTDVREGSPAALAGVVKKDVVVALDGAAVKSFQALKQALAAKKPADAATLTLQRGDEKVDVKVTLAARRVPEEEPPEKGKE
ncbi:MAG: tetratricopeptide repeat protein [Planctomycetes bacterium]|nr:tetratricopeptide repeat protein [Planctomycetota bacterium]